ncbi:MAG: hypothetical protein LBI90_05445 [Treponema sp.]|jgi:hypothetical protein|nr:hypothetical protein [Treponema sp.]
MIKEIWIPETIIVLFLFLPQLQSFFKALEELPGLNRLPLLALFITAGIFPAYGFRLECIPLLVYAFAYNFILIIRFASSRRRNDGGFSDEDSGYPNPLFKVLSLLFLGLFLLPAYLFAPQKEEIPVSEGVRTIPIRDEKQGRDYFVRIYDSPVEGKHPLVLIIPPESGSVPVIDPVCDELRRLGFTAVTYSRKGFDSPALGPDERNTAPVRSGFSLRRGVPGFAAGGTFRKYILSPFLQGRFLRLYLKGAVQVKANAIGRSLETGRLEDLRFLLPRFLQNSEAEGPLFGPDTVKESIFLAGYNAGGGGALYYASENRESDSTKPEISGIITIESNFWSLMQGEEDQPEDIPEGSGVIFRFRINLRNRLRGLNLRGFNSLKISGLAEPPETGKPILLVVSDRAFGTGAEEAGSVYGALFQVFTRSVSGPRLLAAVPGAGSLDYSSIPVTKPLYSLLLRGKGKKIWTGEDYPVKTADLIAGFASSVLKAEEGTGTIRIDKDGGSWEGLFLESRNSGDLRYILE